jgi:hypothetical protein
MQFLGGFHHERKSEPVHQNYEAILDACQDAWRKLLAETGRITSIAQRDWATVGQEF